MNYIIFLLGLTVGLLISSFVNNIVLSIASKMMSNETILNKILEEKLGIEQNKETFDEKVKNKMSNGVSE